MTSKLPEGRWIHAIRRVFPGFLRDRHYASINGSTKSAPKMEPIAKIVADAGRNSTTPAD